MIFALACLMGFPALMRAQENYFVTYTHHMEEPGSLEVGNKSVTGFPKGRPEHRPAKHHFHRLPL